MFQDPKGYISQMCEVHLQTSMETVQQSAGFKFFSSQFLSILIYSL